MTVIKPTTKLALSLCLTLFAFFASGCYSQGSGVSWGGHSGYAYGYTAPRVIIPFSGSVFHTNKPARHKFAAPHFRPNRHGYKGRFSGHSRPGRHRR